MNNKSALRERHKQAQRIIKDPSQFKICVGCESIVTITASHCPNCHAYRFEDDQELVKQQAEFLASRTQSSVIASDLD